MLMSNIVPMIPGINRVSWKLLEDQTRQQLNTCVEAYIVVGAMGGSAVAEIDQTEVRIPDLLWKATAIRWHDDFRIEAFTCRNYSGATVQKTNIQNLEKLTGFKLLEKVRVDE